MRHQKNKHWQNQVFNRKRKKDDVDVEDWKLIFHENLLRSKSGKNALTEKTIISSCFTVAVATYTHSIN